MLTHPPAMILLIDNSLHLPMHRCTSGCKAGPTCPETHLTAFQGFQILICGPSHQQGVRRHSTLVQTQWHRSFNRRKRHLRMAGFPLRS